MLRWINTYHLCAVCRVRVLRYGTFYLCALIVFIQSFIFIYSGRNFWISCTTLIGHYIGSALLWYVADFLLVYIYTLVKRLRDKELRVGVSGNVADLAHFYA